ARGAAPTTGASPFVGVAVCAEGVKKGRGGRGTRPEQATPVPDAPFVRVNGETRAGVSLLAMTRFVRAIEPRESEHRLRPKVRLALQPTPCPCTAGGASIQAPRRTGGRCHRSRARSAVPEVAAFPVERESSRLHAVPTPLW